MKVLIFPFLIILTTLAIYLYKSFQQKRHRKVSRKVVGGLIGSASILFALGLFGMYYATIQPDIQCSQIHATTSKPPTQLLTNLDYFDQGNYLYDIGNCQEAIISYTKSIELNPSYPQSINNRGYTYMRMNDYVSAMSDFNQALILRPDYIQALMNRGDLYNYYGPTINKQLAFADYQKVISLGGGPETSVCGHLFLAKHNGWNFRTYLDFFKGDFRTCK